MMLYNGKKQKRMKVMALYAMQCKQQTLSNKTTM